MTSFNKIEKPVYHDIYKDEIETLNANLSAKKVKIENFIIGYGCLLCLIGIPFLIIFLESFFPKIPVILALVLLIGSMYIIGYGLEILLNSNRIYEKMHSVLIEKRNKLIQKQTEELEKYQLEYQNYLKLQGLEIKKSYEEALPKLDQIKNRYLYRKRLLSSNKVQWEKWNEYKYLIDSLWIDPPEELIIDVDLWYKIRYHNHYRLHKFRGDPIPPPIKEDEFKITSKPKIVKTSSKPEIIKEEVPTKEEKAILELDKFLERMLTQKNNNTNYVEERNALGLRGEEFVLAHEKQKLLNKGIYSDQYPVHVSKIHGDRFGFDILTLDSDLKPLLLEVKTTEKGRNHPFYLTRNELSKMRDYKGQYRIVRLYDYDENSKTFKLEYITKNNLDKDFRLQEELYKVYIN